jgi:hypothetical protein
MGEGFEDGTGYDQGNQWEMREAFLINLDLVGCREEDYFSLDHHQRVRAALPPATRKAMRAMIDDCEAKYENWGFKEPLTCLSYHLWKEVLPEHQILAVYRAPQEVMNHYGVSLRHPRVGWKALRAWRSYNSGVLEALRAAGKKGLLLRYEALMQGDSEFHRLEEFLGRPLADVRQPRQYRATSRNEIFTPIDLCLGMLGKYRPSRLLEDLEDARHGIANES